VTQKGATIRKELNSGFSYAGIPCVRDKTRIRAARARLAAGKMGPEPGPPSTDAPGPRREPAATAAGATSGPFKLPPAPHVQSAMSEP